MWPKLCHVVYVSKAFDHGCCIRAISSALFLEHANEQSVRRATATSNTALYRKQLQLNPFVEHDHAKGGALHVYPAILSLIECPTTPRACRVRISAWTVQKQNHGTRSTRQSYLYLYLDYPSPARGPRTLQNHTHACVNDDCSRVRTTRAPSRPPSRAGGGSPHAPLRNVEAAYSLSGCCRVAVSKIEYRAKASRIPRFPRDLRSIF